MYPLQYTEYNKKLLDNEETKYDQVVNDIRWPRCYFNANIFV